MAFFEFPHTRTYDNDLGWLIAHVIRMSKQLENFINLNTIKYADPIAWNITTQYEANTVVINPADGTAYISTQPVPSGVAISNTDYWTPIFNYGEALNELREQIAAANEEDRQTASKSYAAGEFVWLNGKLYEILYDIAPGTAFIEGTNVQHITIEEKLRRVIYKFDTLPDLLASDLKAGIYAATGGYYAVNDGGGAVYRIVETAPSGYFETMESGLYAELMIDNRMDARQFGAYGDGVHDDTAAIQAAIDHSPGLILSNGSYIIDPVNMDATGTFYGVKLKSNFSLIGVNANIVTPAGRLTGRVIKSLTADTLQNVVIDGITFIGHATSSTSDESGLVAMEHVRASNYEIKNCVFTGFNKNIELTLCSRCDIHDNTILDAVETATQINGYGVLLEVCSDCIVEHNSIKVDRHCVYVNECNGVVVKNNRCTGSNVVNPSFSNYEGNIKIDGSDNIQVTGNLIEYNYYGIGFHNGFAADRQYGGKHCLIADNVIKNTIRNSGLPWGAISLISGSVEDVTIARNSIYIDDPQITPAYRGILVYANPTPASVVSADRLRIVDNEISGFGNGIRYEDVVGVGCVFGGNVVDSCTVPYQVAGTSHQFGGDWNYYKNCDNAPVIEANAFRYSPMKGFKPLDGTVGTPIAGVGINPFADDLQYSTAATTIAGIAGGCEGQILTLRSLANGGIVITRGSIANVNVVSDFNGNIGHFIMLKCMNSTWYEIARFTG